LYAAALAREQNKLDKSSKKQKAAKKTAASNADSDSSSDESMHNLEAKIPRKKACKGNLLKSSSNILGRNVKMSLTEKELRETLKKLQKQNNTVEVLDPDSEEEEDFNASEEERAFLMAIDQEEKLQKAAEMDVSSTSEADN